MRMTTPALTREKALNLMKKQGHVPVGFNPGCRPRMLILRKNQMYSTIKLQNYYGNAGLLFTAAGLRKALGALFVDVVPCHVSLEKFGELGGKPKGELRGREEPDNGR
ncbi:hypothetical protein Dda_7659 [Drechslerella dactyloides]|uniref:Uncharacterized protein n=1 Tax=Drechslerella dactyloides TaxID=74499 RepID=A0AAD6ISK3_DREDA|nr:hypothetical protein Dda_7659 [Drechslerella dactyloides]